MRKAIAIGAVLLIGCAAVPPEEDVPVHGGSGHVCNAAPVQNLIGRQATSELGADAVARSGSRALRWIRPGDVVTMDYRTDRLNIDLDSNGRVTGLRCG